MARGRTAAQFARPALGRLSRVLSGLALVVVVAIVIVMCGFCTAGAPVQQQADRDGAAGSLAGLPGHSRLQPAQRRRHLPGGPGRH